jgi:hypothetical protein
MQPVPFNDATARRILELLERGPASLLALTADGYALDKIGAQTIALASAGRIWPVEPDTTADGPDRINAEIRRRVGTSEEITYRALLCRTAIEAKTWEDA